MVSFLQETPLPFIGAVVAIAVLFRAGIGLVRPASGDAEAPAAITLNETPRSPQSVSSASAPRPAPSAQGAASATTPVVAAGRGQLPRRSLPHPREAAPRKKPRTHGRR